MAGNKHTNYKALLQDTRIEAKTQVKLWCENGCHEYWNPEPSEREYAMETKDNPANCIGCPLNSLLTYLRKTGKELV